MSRAVSLRQQQLVVSHCLAFFRNIIYFSLFRCCVWCQAIIRRETDQSVIQFGWHSPIVCPSMASLLSQDSDTVALCLCMHHTCVCVCVRQTAACHTWRGLFNFVPPCPHSFSLLIHKHVHFTYYYLSWRTFQEMWTWSWNSTEVQGTFAKGSVWMLLGYKVDQLWRCCLGNRASLLRLFFTWESLASCALTGLLTLNQNGTGTYHRWLNTTLPVPALDSGAGTQGRIDVLQNQSRMTRLVSCGSVFVWNWGHLTLLTKASVSVRYQPCM